MPPMMHSISIRFHPTTPEDVRTAFFAVARRAALAQDACLAAFAGRDLGLGAGEWDGALVVAFASEDGYRTYMASDEHRRLAERFGSSIAAKASTQFPMVPA